MTREEAINILDRRTTIPGDGFTWEQINEAIDMAIAALASSQKRVEEVWRGEWKESNDFDYGFWICSRCGFVSEASAAPKLYKFCPSCGCPLTDEAVQMVMERLEAMKDEAD